MINVANELQKVSQQILEHETLLAERGPCLDTPLTERYLRRRLSELQELHSELRLRGHQYCFQKMVDNQNGHLWVGGSATQTVELMSVLLGNTDIGSLESTELPRSSSRRAHQSTQSSRPCTPHGGRFRVCGRGRFLCRNRNTCKC